MCQLYNLTLLTPLINQGFIYHIILIAAQFHGKRFFTYIQYSFLIMISHCSLPVFHSYLDRFYGKPKLENSSLIVCFFLIKGNHLFQSTHHSMIQPPGDKIIKQLRVNHLSVIGINDPEHRYHKLEGKRNPLSQSHQLFTTYNLLVVYC